MLKRNIVANYFGHGYTMLLAVVVTPMFLAILGPEEFGLIGFFILFSSWLQLLTTGLNPTLARQVAIFRGRGELTSTEFQAILRSLEIVVFVLSFITAVSVWLASGWLARSWLNATGLSLDTVSVAVAAMGLIAALRWGVSLYSSGLAGMEQQVWLNGFNVAIATMRNFGGLMLVIQLPSIGAYFHYQLVLSLVELLAIRRAFYVRLATVGSAPSLGLHFSISALTPVLPFILATTYSAIVWVLITQLDKLLISRVLPLDLFGYFSFAILLANGVLRVSDPINAAFLPRLTVLVGSGNRSATRDTYNLAAQFLCVISFSTAGVLAVFPRQVMILLSGDQDLTDYVASFLPWFALGNAILAVSTILYLLQVAHGRLRHHIYLTNFSALVQVPVLAHVAINYGPLLLGITWFIFRLGVFVVMSPIVHHAFAHDSYLSWLKRSILWPATGTAAAMTFCGLIDAVFFNSIEMTGRLQLLLILGSFVSLALSGAMLGAADVRRLAFAKLIQINLI